MRKIDVEQGSYEWHCLRQGKVTGTTLKSALGAPKVQETLMYKLIAELMTEPQIQDINTPAIIRGKEIEPLARKAVSKETCIEFIETGVLVSDDIPGFSLSPDAIYEENGVIIGGLEVKCPDSKKHVEYLCKNALPAEYFHQVIAPFIMSDDIKWWYFASFDDRNYEKPLFPLKMTRDQFNSIEADREKLTAFIDQVNRKHAEITF